MMGKIIDNQKDIMIKILVFFVTIFFLIFFHSLFGKVNAFIGITTIAIIMMLFDKDLTDKPLATNMKLLTLNLLMILASLTITLNFSIFLILNIIICFFIGYYFSYDIDKPIHIPFLLQYLFINITPVTGLDLGLRVVALLIGPIIFFLLQTIVNKRYPISSASVSLLSLSNMIVTKLELLDINHSVRNINKSITSLTNDLRGDLYEQQVNGLTSAKDCINYLNLSIAFEKISNVIEKNNISKAMHLDLIELLYDINAYFKGEIKINKISRQVTSYIRRYQTKNILKERLELFNQLNLIKERLTIINRPLEGNKQDNNTVIKRLKLDQYFDFKSLSFSFAVKLSLGVSSIYLIANLFNLEAAIWLILSFILTLNYAYEDAPKKITNIMVLLVASLLFIGLIRFIQLPLIFLIIISMLLVYFLNYISNNWVKLITGGLLVIGVGVANDSHISLWLITLYLLTGSVVGFIFNNYIYPFKLKNKSIELKTLFYEVIKDMMQEVYNNINSKSYTKKGQYNISNLYLTASLILEQLNMYQDSINIKEPNQQAVRRHLSADLYEFYIVSERIADLKEIKKQFNYIFKTTEYKDLYPVKIESKSNYTIDDKLAIILLNNIIKELQYTKLRR